MSGTKKAWPSSVRTWREAAWTLFTSLGRIVAAACSLRSVKTAAWKLGNWRWSCLSMRRSGEVQADFRIFGTSGGFKDGICAHFGIRAIRPRCASHPA